MQAQMERPRKRQKTTWTATNNDYTTPFMMPYSSTSTSTFSSSSTCTVGNIYTRLSSSNYSYGNSPTPPPLPSPSASSSHASTCISASTISANGIIISTSYYNNLERLVSDCLKCRIPNCRFNDVKYTDKRYEFVQFIYKLSRQFKFHPETSWIAMYYFDKYMDKVKVVHRKQFYLVSIGCLYLASKMEEEILEPNCSDIAKKCGGIASAADIRRVEKKVLNGLDWDFSHVTPHAVICLILESLNLDNHSSHILDHVQPHLDVISLKTECVKFDALVIAVACLQMLYSPSEPKSSKVNRNNGDNLLLYEWERLKSFINFIVCEFRIKDALGFWNNVYEVAKMVEHL